MLPKLKSVCANNLLLYCDMQNPPLPMALFYSSFKMTSNINEELIQLCNRMVCKAMLSKPSPEHLVEVLWREVGKDTLSMRRWKDPIFIERLLLLLFLAEVMVHTGDINL